MMPTSGEHDHGEPIRGAPVQGAAARRSDVDFRVNHNSGAVIFIENSQVGEISAGAACNSVPHDMRNAAPAKGCEFTAMPLHEPPQHKRVNIEVNHSGTVIVVLGSRVPHVVIPNA